MGPRRLLALALACAAAALCGSSETAAPSQVRLSLGDAPDEMRVSWQTEGPTAASVVQYAPLASRRRLREAALFPRGDATDTGAGKRTATGVQWRFEASPTRSVMLHQVTLRGLEPGVSYAYRVGGGDASPWSQRFVLRAPRPRDDDAAPLRLLAFCDAGEVDDARAGALHAAMLDAETAQYDALLHCGDFAYDLENDNGERGDRFLSSVQPLVASLPYLVAPGNHEQAGNFSHYRNRFAGMPGAGGASDSLFWSADIGPVHLVSYSTEAYFWPKHFTYEHAATQHAWLDADLAAADANRDAVPWIVVMAHRPMYCTVAGGDGRCDAEHEASRQGTMMECSALDGHLCWRRESSKALPPLSVEALMQTHGVDVAVFGHVHAYARHWPVFDEQTLASGPDAYVDPPATVHFTTGAAGNPEMKLGDLPPPLGACGAPWCAFQAGYAPRKGQSADYSYSRITVANATHLRWEQVSATMGGVIDDVWIERSSGAPAFGQRRALHPG